MRNFGPMLRLCSHSILFLAVIAVFGVQANAATTPGGILGVSSNLCLEVSGASTSLGAAIVQNTCVGSSSQIWSSVAVGKHFHLSNKNSGQCLNVPNNSQQLGTPIIQWGCQPASALNDQWDLVTVGTNVHIVSSFNGLCLNIGGASQAPGAAVIQWACQDNLSLNDQFIMNWQTQPPLPSVWSNVISLSVNPVGIANMPNGKIMMWSSAGQYFAESDIGSAASQTYTGIFDPATTTSTQAIITNPGADMFCPGTSVLFDGRVLINGGASSPKTSIFNPITNTWAGSGDMKIPRGYQANTVLTNGQVLTLGGSWSGGLGGKYAELWNGSTWTILGGIPEDNILGPDPQGIYRADNHLWLFATSNGMVFHAGPSSQMNWINPSGAGTIQSAGNRGTDAFSINGNAVLYDVGMIFKVGGAIAYQQDFQDPTYASNSAYLINIKGGPGAVTVKQLAPMAYQRSFANSVVLPNGSVVVVGGQSIPQPFTDTSAVLVPEIWNPTTQIFQKLAPMKTPRTYHSTAILMADGRVFVGGGGQCADGCPENHLDAELLTPPYLLNADGSPATRPVIASAPATGALGGTIAVTTQAAVSSFALMRLSSVTHTTNNDQRRIPLTPTSVSGKKYTLTIPADPGVVLPGYYMLFALSATGVPSVSTSIKIQ